MKKVKVVCHTAKLDKILNKISEKTLSKLKHHNELLTQKELATALGVSLNTIKNRVIPVASFDGSRPLYNLEKLLDDGIARARKKNNEKKGGGVKMKNICAASKEHVEYVADWAGRLVAESYKRVKVYEQILALDVMDSSVCVELSAVTVRYGLGHGEDLSYIANQLLENIDESLNFASIVPTAEPTFNLFSFNCKTTRGVCVEITVDFSDSGTCHVVYEDVVTKKPVMVCR